MDIERAAERGLGAQQPVAPVAIVAQDELGPAGTERAVTVEDDDRPVIGKVRDGRIAAIAVGRLRGGDRDR